MSTVCANNGYCCSTVWDDACADYADIFCPDTPGGSSYCADDNTNGTSDVCEGTPPCNQEVACDEDDHNQPGPAGWSTWIGPTSGEQRFELGTNWTLCRPGRLTEAEVKFFTGTGENVFKINSECNNAVQSLAIWDNTSWNVVSDLTFDLGQHALRIAGRIGPADLFVSTLYPGKLSLTFKNGDILGPDDGDLTFNSTGALRAIFERISLESDNFRVRSSNYWAIDTMVFAFSIFDLKHPIDFPLPDENNEPLCNWEMLNSHLEIGQGYTTAVQMDLRSNQRLSVRHREAEIPGDMANSMITLAGNGLLSTHANSVLSVGGTLVLRGSLSLGGALIGSGTCNPQTEDCAVMRMVVYGDFLYPATTSAYVQLSMDLSGSSGFPTAPAIFTTGETNLGGVLLIDVHDFGFPPSLEFARQIVMVKPTGTLNGNFEVVRTLPGQELTNGRYLAAEQVGNVITLVVKYQPEVGSTPASETTLTDIPVKSVVLNDSPFLMATVSKSSDGLSSILRVLKDNNGELVELSTLDGPADPTDMSSGDIDEDSTSGIADFVVSYGDPGKVIAYRVGTGGASISTLWTKSLNSGGSFTHRATCVTVLPQGGTADGPRVAFGSSTSIGILASSGGVTTLGGDGSNDAEASVAGIPTTVRGSDVDDDGDIDASTGGTGATALQGEDEGFVQMLMTDQDGQLIPLTRVSVTGTPRSMAIADIDGDGFKDVAIASDGITEYFQPGLRPTAALLRGTAVDTRLQDPVAIEVGIGGDSQGTAIALTDADGDGNLDIAVGWSSFWTDTGGGEMVPVRRHEDSTGISLGLPVKFISTKVNSLEPFGNNGLLSVTSGSGTAPSSVSWTTFAPVFIEGDVDVNGAVNGGDIALILLEFGPCSDCPADLDHSGTVDVGDVAYLLLLLD